MLLNTLVEMSKMRNWIDLITEFSSSQFVKNVSGEKRTAAAQRIKALVDELDAEKRATGKQYDTTPASQRMAPLDDKGYADWSNQLDMELELHGRKQELEKKRQRAAAQAKRQERVDGIAQAAEKQMAELARTDRAKVRAMANRAAGRRRQF